MPAMESTFEIVLLQQEAGWRLGFFAFVDILVLLLLIAATTVLFWRCSRLAGALMLPYLLWVSFAAVLNYSLWQLNPQLLG